MSSENNYQEALHNVKIPVLVLDQKWHRLFAIDGKPENVIEIEGRLNNLIQTQGRLNNELKALKKIKSDLMNDIVENMEGAEHASSKKREESKHLLDETKEKIAANEDELMDLPKEIAIVNNELMLATMDFCYGKLRSNKHEIEEYDEWITNIRIELKKNIIRKQNREINNREIYFYMHDIFGKDVCDLFDVKYEDYEKKSENDKDSDGKVIKKDTKQ